MTVTELESWRGFIRCDHCREKIPFDSRFSFNDLQICGKCNNLLHEVKNRKPKHPMEEMNHKIYEPDPIPKRKKGKENESIFRWNL